MHDIYMLMLVSMPLSLMQGHSGYVTAKIPCWIICTKNKQQALNLLQRLAILYVTVILQTFIWLDHLVYICVFLSSATVRGLASRSFLERNVLLNDPSITLNMKFSLWPPARQTIHKQTNKQMKKNKQKRKSNIFSPHKSTFHVLMIVKRNKKRLWWWWIE